MRFYWIWKIKNIEKDVFLQCYFIYLYYIELVIFLYGLMDRGLKNCFSMMLAKKKTTACKLNT